MKRNEFRNYYGQLEKFVKILEAKRYEALPIEMDLAFKDDDGVNTTPDFSDVGYEKITCPHHYGVFDSYHNLRMNINVGKEYANEKLYGIFNMGYEQPGLTIGTETIMYKNGVAHSGIDLNHREIPLGNLEGDVQFDFRIWSGIVSKDREYDYYNIGGHKVNGFYHSIQQPIIARKNEIYFDYFYLLRTILRTYDEIKETKKGVATKLITDAYIAYIKVGMVDDLTDEKLVASYNDLKERLKKYDFNYPYNFKVVGQSHIDVAWLWQVKHTREKIARTFTSMIRLLEENEEFIYFQSQPILLAYLKKDYPDIFKQLKKYIDQGRFEIDGAMWLEADTNIPSGESLTRQIIHGKKFLKENFNIDSKVLWMPDVFGYSAQLPQILKKCDVDWFYTTKMGWNKNNRMPFQTFYWEALDGSKVLTHLQENMWFWEVDIPAIATAWDKYTDSDIFNSLICGFGYGDGGGGPTQSSIEVVKHNNEIGILPKIEFSTVSNYYKSLENDIENNEGPDIHTWRGELYLELHRGTFTSQAKLKFYNRMIENKLRTLEMHMAKTMLDKKLQKDINVEIDNLWEEFLLNQFHDIIPGSGIKEVVRDAEALYYSIVDRCEEVKEKIFANYEKVDTLKILNPTNTNTNYIMDVTNTNVDECIILGDRKFSYVNGTKPLAYTEFKVDEAVVKKSELAMSYDFDKYVITFDDNYNIISLINKQNNVELVNGKFNDLKIYEDKPLDWSAWDIDAYYPDKAHDKFTLESAEVVYETINVLVLKVVKSYMNSTMEQLIILAKHDDFIDFKTKVDWQESEKLLRVEFDNNIKCDNLLCDTQYGNNLRPTHHNTSWEMTKFEFVAHKYVVVEDASTSYALVNNGKYGFNYIDNTLGMTLIKTGIAPDPKQDIGIHEFGYALKLSDSNFTNSEVEDFATLYNSYDTIVNYDIDDEAIFELSNDNLAIDAIKLNNSCDKIIVRVHDYKNMKTDFNISCNVSRVLNSLEDPIDYDLQIGNFEVKTFELDAK